MKVAWLKILLLLVGFNVGLSAQNYHIERHLTVDDGLPSNETYSTFQTDDGDLWICTDRGLARYNGLSMRVYDEDDGLTDNVVFKSYKDYSGRIWLITAGGLSYLEGDSIVSPGFNEELVGHEKYSFINNIHVTLDHIYISIKEPVDGFFLIDRNRKDELTFQSIGGIFSSGCAEIMFFLKQGEQVLINSLIVTTHSLKCNDSIFEENLNADKNISAQFMASERVDFDQNIYSQDLLNSDEVSFFSIHNHVFKRMGNKIILWNSFNRDVLSIYKNNNQIYIGFRGKGVHVYDVNMGTLERNFGNGLIVLDIKQFKDEYIWVNTMNNGVYQYNLTSYVIGSLPDNIELSLSGDPINIHSDTLRVFSNGAIHSYRIDRDSLVFIESKGILNMHSRFLRFHRVNWDEAGVLRFNYGYIPYNSGKKDLVYFPTISRGRGIRESVAIANDSVLYLGDSGFLIAKEDSVLFNSDTIGFEEEIISYEISDSGNLLFGTYYGLYEYNRKDGLFNWAERFEVLNTRIEKIEEIGIERYAVATHGSGLGILQHGTVLEVGEKEGLLSNIVQDVVFDGNLLWVATNRGISRVSLKHAKNGDLQVGTVETILRSVYIDELLYDGGDKVYAQSGKRIYRIDYSDKLDLPKPKILLGEISISGVVRKMAWKNSYSLDHDENTVSLDYRINDLVEPHQQIYEYCLKGRSTNWLRTNERQLTFTNLQPGNYRLEMKARNSYGQWSEEPQWLEFEIRPHFTQTGWFRYGGSAATAFLLGGIVFVYVRNRHRKLAQENFLLNSALNSLKLEMNPHFIFNALNSIQYFIANNQRRDANMFLARFATLIRNVLNATDQKKLSLREEVSKLKDYLELERIRMHRHFSHKITFTNDFDHDKTYLPPMLVQPLIENAIWHGVSELDRPGEILISFNLAKGVLYIVVEDNGKGIDKTVEVFSKKKSRGLRNIQSRLELMSQIERKPYSMSIDSEPGKGTRVELKIPQ